MVAAAASSESPDSDRYSVAHAAESLSHGLPFGARSGCQCSTAAAAAWSPETRMTPAVDLSTAVTVTAVPLHPMASLAAWVHGRALSPSWPLTRGGGSRSCPRPGFNHSTRRGRLIIIMSLVLCRSRAAAARPAAGRAWNCGTARIRVGPAGGHFRKPGSSRSRLRLCLRGSNTSRSEHGLARRRPTRNLRARAAKKEGARGGRGLRLRHEERQRGRGRRRARPGASRRSSS